MRFKTLINSVLQYDNNNHDLFKLNFTCNITKFENEQFRFQSIKFEIDNVDLLKNSLLLKIIIIV